MTCGNPAIALQDAYEVSSQIFTQISKNTVILNFNI